MSAPDSKRAFQFHPVTSELVHEVEALPDNERQEALRKKLGKGTVDTLAAAGLLVGVIKNEDGTTRFVNLDTSDFGTNLRHDRHADMVEAFSVHEADGTTDETSLDNSEEYTLGEERRSDKPAGQVDTLQGTEVPQGFQDTIDTQPTDLNERDAEHSDQDHERAEEPTLSQPNEQDHSAEIENQQKALATSIDQLNANLVHGAMNGLLADYMNVSGQELSPLLNVRRALAGLEAEITTVIGQTVALRNNYNTAQGAAIVSQLDRVGNLLQGGLTQIADVYHQLDGLVSRLRNNDSVRLTLPEVHQIEGVISGLPALLNSIPGIMPRAQL